MSKHVYNHSEILFLDTKGESITEYVKEYIDLFDNLDLSLIPRYNKGIGASGYDQHSLIKAMIVYAREGYRSIPQLIRELKAKPYFSQHVLGFKSTIPEESTFYRFLQRFSHQAIQTLCAQVNLKKLDLSSLELETIAIDSKPIVANTKENNPKCFVHNLSDKTKHPKRNEEAALGFLTSTNDINGKANTIFYWGYKVHLIVDADRDTPLVWEVTKANVSDTEMAPQLYRGLSALYAGKFSSSLAQVADKGYDARAIVASFHDTCGGKSAIAKNGRRNKIDKHLAMDGTPLCKAGLKMKFQGSWYDKKANCQRHRFACSHKSMECGFRKGYLGCSRYLQDSDPIPGKIECFSSAFERIYPKRQAVERVNAYLTRIGFDVPNHFSKASITNLIGFAFLAKALSCNMLASVRLAA